MTDIKELEEKIKIYNKKYYDGNEQITDNHVYMTGPAVTVFDGELYEEAIR